LTPLSGDVDAQYRAPLEKHLVGCPKKYTAFAAAAGHEVIKNVGRNKL